MRQGMTGGRSLTVAVAAIALAVPFAGVALAGDGKGKGDERPQGAPGQVKPEKQPAQRASGNGKGAAKSEKPAKAPKPAAKKAKPSKPAKKSNPHAKAGRTTICHATGSETNPFVRITVSNNALKAHDRHQHDEDVIPAPQGGCPAPAPAPAAAAKPRTDKAHAKPDHAKVTICHATGSEKNPFVRITIAEAAVKAHDRHQHDEDIIPAPQGGCPAQAPAPAAAAAQSAPRSVTGAASPPAATVIAAPFAAPQGGVRGETVSGGDPAADRRDAAPATRREAGAGTAAGHFGSLPFTGLETWLVVAAALGLLLAGVAGRRAAGNRA